MALVAFNFRIIMRHIFLLLVGFSLFHLSRPLFAQGNDAELRATLEKAYLKWRDAMIRSDAQAWAASITRYRQTVIRNSVVSEMQAFPAAVFASGTRPPPLDGLRLLEVQAVGLTAHLVYFGKVDLGQDSELLRDNLLKLKFYQEGGVWKYDSNRITSLNNTPDVRQALANGEHPDFLDSPEYTPPGSMPPPPPLCRVPDFKAGYKLQTFGYETTISMNGIVYEPVQDALDQQILIGGLVKGHNEITLNIKPVPVPEGGKAALRIHLYKLSNDPEKPGAEVLRWLAPESGAPATITLPIEVKP